MSGKILSKAPSHYYLMYEDPYNGWAVNQNPFVGWDDPNLAWYFGRDKTAAETSAKKVFGRICKIREMQLDE